VCLVFTWLVFSLRVKDTVRRQATLPRLMNLAAGMGCLSSAKAAGRAFD
jgi:hypothetical protein